MTAYYNEWESYPAQWLRNLIAANLIALGDVDERSIKDVKADDLKGYTQCHFFAGIGGWSYALRLAGWSDERPVWTGSCPCQPFSNAGSKKGYSDERHLWPDWSRLIGQSKPPTIFGEQVKNAITFGWLDEVFLDLEKQNYSCASAILPACSVDAPHQRDRILFVAHTEKSDDCRTTRKVQSKNEFEEAKRQKDRLSQFGYPSDVSNTDSARLEGQRKVSGRACTELGDVSDNGWWSVEPNVGRVANGVLLRSLKLRALGNAIVPQVAQAFIEAFMECRP